MEKNRYFRAFVVAVLLLNLAAASRVYRRDRELRGGDAGVLTQMGTIVEILRDIRLNYVDVGEVRSRELLAGAMNGMVSKLDGHSAFFPPREARSIKQNLDGQFAGVGITTVSSEKGISVVHLLKGTPAEKAGVKVGDVILAVDQMPAEDHSFEDILEAIRGRAGTPVKLTVLRKTAAGDEKLEFDMVRQMITLDSVHGAVPVGSGEYVYFSVTGFVQNTAEQFEKALKKAFSEKTELKGIIIDLRGNGGGLVRSAVDICSFFLPEGQLVVTSRMQNVKKDSNAPFERKYYAGGGYKVPSYVKLAVLIDRGSASASEITAGCLQDLNRAVVVGEKSYGKGSVQTLFNVGGGNVFKMTVARYYTPVNNKFIDGVGIMPDVVIPIKDEMYAEQYKKRLAGRIVPAEDSMVKAALENFARK